MPRLYPSYTINAETQSVSPLTPADGKKFSLEELQAVVGGYIEIVTLPDGALLICHEDGRLRQLPVNKPASLLVGQPILGNVAVINAKQLD